MGTIKYSSPEQILYNDTSSASDIYSFGLVMCSIILGEIRLSKNLKESVERIKKDTIFFLKNVAHLDQKIVDPVVSLITNTMEYFPDNRIYASEAKKLIEDLISFCTSEKHKNEIIRKYSYVYSSSVSNDGTILINDSLINSFTAIGISRSVLSHSLSIQKSTEGLTTQKWAEAWLNIALNSDDTPSSINIHPLNDHPLNTNKKNKEGKVKYYSNQLEKEYNNILFQAKVSFSLWVFSFIVCFGIIFVSVYSFFSGSYFEGITTSLLRTYPKIIEEVV